MIPQATFSSPLFGPGKAWYKATWHGHDINNNNVSQMKVMAYDKNGKDTTFYTLEKTTNEINISAIDASKYPFVQLRMTSKDSLTALPYQLDNWSVEYAPIPEGTMAPNLGINIPDTVEYDHNINVSFDTLQGYITFKNISQQAFTPIKAVLSLYSASDTAKPIITFPLQRTKALNANDTAHIGFLVNITSIPEGTYNLYIEANPDNDQPEQYHFNNYLYKYLTVIRSKVLPVHLLDFTAQPFGKNVQLKWKVTNEINLHHYDVEFSRDGQHNFTSIGIANATPSNELVKDYSLLHRTPVYGKNYYRIKMVDNDGRFSYSPVRMASFNTGIISAFPNPFFSQLNITVTKTDVVSKVQLYSIAGQLLTEKSFWRHHHARCKLTCRRHLHCKNK